MHWKQLLLICSMLVLTACGQKEPQVKKEYYTGGTLRAEFIMSDESGLNGVRKTYGYQGELLSKSTIQNGLKNGIEEHYDKGGKVIQRIPYLNGYKDGVMKAYYPNGQVMLIYTYLKDTWHGRAAKFDQQGTLLQEVWYENGRVVR
ncbi:MAG TPA: hypothetical protein ENK72_02130 [Epsilonproteobacteria bacterium]|nr:hypothetical protein [Campylobacterota bacterium]